MSFNVQPREPHRKGVGPALAGPWTLGGHVLPGNARNAAAMAGSPA